MVMRMPNLTAGPAMKRKPTVRRIDVPSANEAGAEAAPAAKAGQAADSGEEKCPVIRASQIMFSSATAGRLKVVFF
jgi:hypothetical protein